MPVISEKETTELMVKVKALKQSLRKFNQSLAEFRAARVSLEETLEEAKK